MPLWLRSGLRRKASIVVAMLYALGVLTPHFAHADALSSYATGPFSVAAYDDGAIAAHHHAGDATHHHATAEHPTSHHKHDNNDTDPKCCAQITLTVLPQQNADPAFAGLFYSPDFLLLVAKLTGRSADRLDRPPNV